MSMHKVPLTDIEYQGLVAHGLDIHKPSQLSDAFRQGVAWATLHFTLEDVLTIDAALREDHICPKINQCDGCQAGIPLINGTHRMGEPDGYPNKIKCTADLYK